MDLCGKILIAMPGMGDGGFGHSIVFLCAHSDEGAMGLIVNKPAKDLTFKKLVGQLDIAFDESALYGQQIPPVYFGGPVERGRGFVLHSPEYGTNPATLRVNGDFAMTATLNVLEDIARGQGPQACLLALGYAGWAPGQLEDEIAQNGWLTCDGHRDLVFQAPDTTKWSRALKSLGVDALSLSAAAGRA